MSEAVIATGVVIATGPKSEVLSLVCGAEIECVFYFYEQTPWQRLILYRLVRPRTWDLGLREKLIGLCCGRSE